MNNNDSNRGSTLVLVVMIFAVLMIFGTVVLGLTATENKQAMYYQNKAQAYYIAKSGADVVEAAIVEQLRTYGENANDIAGFLLNYNTPYNLHFLIEDNDVNVTIRYAKLNDNSPNKVLIIDSVANYRDVEETVSKALYSTETIISSVNKKVTFSGEGQFMIYIDEAKQHDNKGISSIPTNYARPATELEKANFGKQEFPVINDWSHPEANLTIPNDDNNEIIFYDDSISTYGTVGKTTHVIVNGSLILNKEINFIGNVNIYVRKNVMLNTFAKVNSEKEVTEDGTLYRLNFYIYNEGYDNNGSIGLTSGFIPISDVNITGNFFLDQGKINLSFHQRTFIDGNIMYNGSEDVSISVQSNNISNLSKILGGSIYTPFAKVNLGRETDKTAFVIDGFIYAKEIHIYAHNSSQANKFYNGSANTSSTILPIETSETINTRAISYGSYYID